ncbi:MAG: Na(+)-translocating NADH-quinone reductase subunit A [Burkholderiaceae bacterium]|nr:Na(+)-translocating NADH-quinone reductase subunit A [Burkholderiaceae bacterium]
MALHKNSKGLDLPLAGAPERRIEPARAVTRVALLGADTIGLKPTLLVQPGDIVRRGQPVYEDKGNPGVRFTAPAAGRVQAVNRGERRVFVSLEIETASDDAQVEFTACTGRTVDQLSRDDVRALLLESGLWTALRARPFGRVPKLDAEPAALFVTAIDTRPHAPDIALALESRAEAFRTGLAALAKLTRGPTFVCKAPGVPLDVPAGVQVEEFAGPHPAGNVSWHIHRLSPVGLAHHVWHIGAQDVAAIGTLVLRGELDTQRVVSLAGPGIAQPRLLRTRLGAAIDELVAGELKPGEQRVISGSVLDGRGVGNGLAAPDAYLGRYHAQVAALPEGHERELFGWITPSPDKFSVTGAVLGAFLRTLRPLSTTTNGSPRAMVPIGTYERVLPFDIEPTFLLRALITKDDPRAIALGALELDEDDIALATCVCPGKYEYGPLLRDALTRIEKEIA